MALLYADYTKETTTTTGTGTLTLAGAVTGFQAFSAAFSTGQTVQFSTTDGTNWEVAEGVYTTSGTTLTRATIIASSNSGSAVSWGAGSKTVACVSPAYIFNPVTNFTASSTNWTAPASGILLVTGCGGGGSGGGANNGGNGQGGGGGGGALQQTVLVSVVAGTTYTVTVGAGGGAPGVGTVGNAGSASSFGSLAQFNGASGGMSTRFENSGSAGTIPLMATLGGAGFVGQSGGNVYLPNLTTAQIATCLGSSTVYGSYLGGSIGNGGGGDWQTGSADAANNLGSGSAGNYNCIGSYAGGSGGTSGTGTGGGGGGGGGAGPAGKGGNGGNGGNSPSGAGIIGASASANTGAGGGGGGAPGGGANNGNGGAGGSGFVTIHYV